MLNELRCTYYVHQSAEIAEYYAVVLYLHMANTKIDNVIGDNMQQQLPRYTMDFTMVSSVDCQYCLGEPTTSSMHPTTRPLTKIVTWVYDTEIHNDKSISRNWLHSIIHLHFEHPRKCTLGAFYWSETNKIDFYTKCWSKNHINSNENTFLFRKQNLTMNITAKRNLSFNADSILINLKITDLRPIV